MAALIPTAEGSGEADNIYAWLQENNLSKYYTKFKDDGWKSTKELMDYTDADIDELCQAYNIKIPYKKRFISAIKKVQQNQHSNNINLNNAQHIRTIVLSTKESESRKLLTFKLKEIQLFLENNINQTNQLNEQIKLTENKIKTSFVLLKEALQNREKDLLNKLYQKNNKYYHQLQKQKEILQQYQISIKNTQKKQNILINDNTLNDIKREIKLVQLTDNTLKNINVKHIRSNPPQLMKFSIDTSKSCKYITNIGRFELAGIEPQPHIVQPVSRRWNCIKCSFSNDLTYKFCVKCGTMNIMGVLPQPIPQPYYDNGNINGNNDDLKVSNINNNNNTVVVTDNDVNEIVLSEVSLINSGLYNPSEHRETGWIVKNISSKILNLNAKIIKIGGGNLVKVRYENKLKLNMKPNDEKFILLSVDAPGIPGQYHQFYQIVLENDNTKTICRMLKLPILVRKQFNDTKESKIANIIQNIGFNDRKKVIQSLKKWNWDECKAINWLVTHW